MLLRWLRGAGARPGEIAAMQARIPDALWTDVLHAYPFLRLPTDNETSRLRERAAWILASKTLNGAGGLQLHDFMRLTIATQAALPILNLATTVYEGWQEIIVYPGSFSVLRQHEDDDGVVHEYIEEAAGEAWQGGPVVLSWDGAEPDNPAVPAGSRHAPPHAYNVVIHEFAHKLDFDTDGQANGVPALHRHADIKASYWRRVLADGYARFSLSVQAVEDSIPAHIDPESPHADPWYAQLPMDPYAASDEAEFFAVSSETFFTQPEPLARDLPEWYALLAAYYRQDPIIRTR